MIHILRNVILASSLCSASVAYAQVELPVIADQIPFAYTSAFKAIAPLEIKHPGAQFIKIHFKTLILPAGSSIRLTSKEGTEVLEYTQSQENWFAQSIFGEQVTVELLLNQAGEVGEFDIDYFTAGYQAEMTASRGDSTFSTCGINERKDVACWQESHADKVAWSSPVARLLIDGRSLCTAWRVGPDNTLFTNNHCVSTASELKNTEVWFNYQRSSCNGSLATTVKVMGSELLRTDYTLDYTLFSVDDFAKIAAFGYLGLDANEPVYGDGIYIPQHGAGNPKELAIESDQNGSGLCQIDIASTNGRGTNTDTGYFCDTIGGSSGSPVLNAANNKAIALHHFGGCENQGVKISRIWPQVATYFNNTLPEGSIDPTTPTIEELIPDSAITDLALNKGEEKMFVVKAENRLSALTVAIQFGAGDADLYVRSGEKPTTSVYDCRPFRSGNNESCSVPAAGKDLYIMVRAYSHFSGVMLNASKQ
ncbi:serine protease [Vibrio cidicii]|uniref:trypsin-like peptidase domain-containing protein n=1 Tax=Vibrio cidicii TaxID=1763883 RepID=UPI003750A6E6